MIYAHVDEQAVASVVSDWTGIPVGKMVADEVETVLQSRRDPQPPHRRPEPRPDDDRQAHRDQSRQARQSQQADRRLHAVRALGRRQDRDGAGARRDALRRRAEHHHDQHVGVPGGPYRLDAQGRASRLCRLRRGRPPDRGGPPAPIQRGSARRDREGPSRRARNLLPGLRQGRDGGRHGPAHRFQEYADPADLECRHRSHHGRRAAPQAARPGGARRRTCGRRCSRFSRRRCWGAS